MMADPSSSSGGIDGDDGAWIGIDFGTTHSCAAVWDSNRSRPKVLRLASALPEDSGKRGRLVPTVLVLVRSTVAQDQLLALVPNPKDTTAFYTTDDLRSLNLVAVVGSPALRLLDQHQAEAARTEQASSAWPSPEQVSSAMITDLKIHFSASPTDASASPSPMVRVVPIGMSAAVSIEADVLVQVFLAAMRHESEEYLLHNRRKKGLVVPCANASCTRVDHAVIGVPCHWNQRQRHSLERIAVQRAPRPMAASSSDAVSPTTEAAVTLTPVVIDVCAFHSARALTEPTAAGLSYGLGVGQAAKRVMVLDVGGGTTDVSISELSNDHQRVAVTEGAQVGGNDVDRALLQWFLKESKIAESETNLSQYDQRTLLRTCKNAKEDLCNRWSSSAIVCVSFQSHVVRLDTATFLSVAEPVLKRIEAIVVQSLKKYRRSTDNTTTTTTAGLDEVVMVGGSTKIPPVAAMLRRVTHRDELCQVHPLTAVAQGTAIHAARLSNCVPIHELQSALLLDALPYAIGVMVPSSSTMPSSHLDDCDFVPVLAQYASVPSLGSVKFALADKAQTGVTVPVVERIDDGTNVPRLEKIQSFQFLLRKLTPEQLRAVSTRYVEIRIQFTEIGQLFVTAVDELDPEHQRRYNVQPSDDVAAKLVASSDAPPLGLILTTLALAILYIAVKLSFHEAELKST